MARQGETLASWSSVVTTISSPGRHVLPIERLMWNVSVVMLAPNLISWPDPALRNSATASCARSVISSLRWLVRNAPPSLAFDVS